LSQESKSSYIVDANVLIDYCDSDLQMLSLLSEKLGPVHIARSTFDKVQQLTKTVAKKNHLLIKTPDSETIIAASTVRGSLAYDDRETLLLAKSHGWICITNDKPLRRECKTERVACLWGLEPMRILVEQRIVLASHALTVAKKIQLAHPGSIYDDIVNRFEKQVKEIQTKRRKK